MGNESEILWPRSKLVSELIVRTIISLIQDEILLVWFRSYRDGKGEFLLQDYYNLILLS